PLIYDCETDIPEIKYRSISFYYKVSNNNKLYFKLNEEQKIIFSIGIRDMYIAQERNLLNNSEVKILEDIINLLHNNIISINVEGMNLTPNPTSNNKLIKYSDSIEFNDSVLQQYFIKNNVDMYMVFVDPQELSYHNFENIINLDKYF